MTKQHFEAFAATLKADLLSGKVDYACAVYAATTFAEVATRSNARFDHQRFMKACGL